MYWAFVQAAAVVQPFQILQFLFGVRVEEHALATQGVREQHLSGEPRNSDAGFLEQANALQQGRLKGHGREAPARGWSEPAACHGGIPGGIL
jgi:hypothetical protein